jgi:hypothetical protein
MLILFLAVALAVAGYFYENSISYKNPTLAAQTEAESLAKEVGKLIILPSDEVPTIATVSDPTALSNQAFFTNAKKGDKVLIYTSAKIAILYDPVVKKIVTVAPVNLGDLSRSASLSPDSTGSVSTSSNNEF